jgi:hypothetical protein
MIVNSRIREKGKCVVKDTVTRKLAGEPKGRMKRACPIQTEYDRNGRKGTLRVGDSSQCFTRGGEQHDSTGKFPLDIEDTSVRIPNGVERSHRKVERGRS